jgi:DNA-binding transcriptional ArsR family regulator
MVVFLLVFKFLGESMSGFSGCAVILRWPNSNIIEQAVAAFVITLAYCFVAVALICNKELFRAAPPVIISSTDLRILELVAQSGPMSIGAIRDNLKVNGGRGEHDALTSRLERLMRNGLVMRRWSSRRNKYYYMVTDRYLYNRAQ